MEPHATPASEQSAKARAIAAVTSGWLGSPRWPIEAARDTRRTLTRVSKVNVWAMSSLLGHAWYLCEGYSTATRPELRHRSRMRQTRKLLAAHLLLTALLAHLDGSDLRYGLDGRYALDLYAVSVATVL
eukprot:scaffold68154_cov60-Phaeocystis_antarctica.AAC.1